jgi:hypothetical protein
MTKFIGRLVDVGIGREVTRGLGANGQYRLPTTSLSFDDKVVKARSVGALSNIADSEETFVTTKYGQGDIEGEVRSNSFGLLLYSALGTYSVTGPSDSAYTHSFTVSQSNQHQSLCFIVKDENTTESYKLVMLDSLELTAELDQVLMFNASFMSKTGASTALTVPLAFDEYKFTKKHLSVKIASDIATLSTVDAIKVKSVTLKISKNVALDDALGSVDPDDILNRQLAVEGTITLNYESETYKNYMKDGNHKALQIAFTNTDRTISTGSTNPSLTIQLPKVDFEWEPSYDLDEIVTQKLTFKANRDVANNQQIIHLCQLVNGVATYSYGPSASLSPSPSGSVSPSGSISPSGSTSKSQSPSVSPSHSASMSPSFPA